MPSIRELREQNRAKALATYYGTQSTETTSKVEEKPIVKDDISIQEPDKPKKQVTINSSNQVTGGKDNGYNTFPTFVPTTLRELATSFREETEDNPTRDGNIFRFVESTLENGMRGEANKAKDPRMKSLTKHFVNYYKEVLRNADSNGVDPDDVKGVMDDFFENKLIKEGLLKINDKPYNPEDNKSTQIISPTGGSIRNLNEKGIEHKKNIDKLKAQFLNTVFGPTYNATKGLLVQQNATNKELNGVGVTDQGSDRLLEMIKNTDYKGFELLEFDESKRKLIKKSTNDLRNMIEGRAIGGINTNHSILSSPNITSPVTSFMFGKSNSENATGNPTGNKAKVVTSYIGALGNGLDNVSRVQYGNKVYYLRLQADSPDSPLAQNYHNLITSSDYTQSNLKSRFNEYSDNTDLNSKGEFDYGGISRKLINQLTTSTPEVTGDASLSSDKRFEKGVAKISAGNDVYRIYVTPGGGYDAINSLGETIAGDGKGILDMRKLVEQIDKKTNYSITKGNGRK